MKTVTVINQKGGVGKSTTALHIAVGLKNKGYKVLYVDMDAQGNSTYTLGGSNRGYGVLGVLQRTETIKEEIQHLDSVDLIASSSELSKAEIILNNIIGKEYRLKEALDQVKKAYDYCIIDTPPNLSILTINSLVASGYALIPTTTEIYSLQGIYQLKGTIDSIIKYCNSDLKVLGILITMYNSRSQLSRDLLEALEDIAKDFNSKLLNAKIRRCEALKKSQALKQDVFRYDPKCNGSLDYKELIEEILSEVR